MEWYQVLTIIGANVIVFFGFMGSVIAMFMHLNKRVDKVIDEMQAEMKDFHGRLVAIEERRLKGRGE